MQVNRYYVSLIFGIFFLFATTIVLYFKEVKSELVEDFVIKNKVLSIYLKSVSDENAFINRNDTLDAVFNYVVNNEAVQSIELDFNRYVFSNETLKSKFKNDFVSFAQISDVTVDAKYGNIVMLEDSVYELIPSMHFNKKTPVKIKFQLQKSGFVVNSVIELNFYQQAQKSISPANNTPSLLLNLFDTIDETAVTVKLFHNNLHFADLNYRYDAIGLYNEIYKSLKNIFFYASILMFLLFFLLIIFYKTIFEKEIFEPISKISGFLEDMSEGRFAKVELKDYKIKKMLLAMNNIKAISKKVASLSNELNVTKDKMEKFLYTDQLTGLENKKLFDVEIERMLNEKSDGYVALLKIANLQKYTQEFGPNKANSLIKEFVSLIKTHLHGYEKYEHNFYRFYGAEFAFIVKKIDYQAIDKLLEALSQKLLALQEKHSFDYNLVNIGAIPFDYYGNLEDILSSTANAYKKSLSLNDKIYFLVDGDKIFEKARKLETIVKNILEQDMIDIDFIFDTFELSINKKLVMQEVAPNITNPEDNTKFPIGTFFAVSQKMKLLIAIDKKVIQKTIQVIKEENIVHDIAVNVSMLSIEDNRFISWLNGELLYNSDVTKYLVFSINTQTVANNFTTFKSFIETIHKYESKVLLKRFTFDDISKDKLETLDVDFIRIDQNFCTAIEGNHAKINTIKSLILYGQKNDVVILGDNIRENYDVEFVEGLGLYATS